MKNILGLAAFAAICTFIYGWFANLIALVHLITADAPFTALLLGRALGVFLAPLGAVLGYF